MSDDAHDPSAPDAGVATAPTVDARVGRGNADDPTRTSAADASATPAPARIRDDRLPAPLQYRDPERYEIIGEHGRGGLGRVLRARDRELGRDVAVKELLNRGNTSELRFFREALITARLEHPGIVPVHEAGRWPDGTPFYAMKLVQGRPLREVIDECKTLDERLALLPHLIAVADAIAYAHARKIIHRDLKPSNVIVGSYGETVVIDWGLAKDLTSEIADPIDEGPYRTPASDGITVAGSVLGTPAYMAPEQQEGKADERADIYALGAMIVHVVTGRAPNRRKDGAPVDLSEFKGVPRDLVAIVARATERSPRDRYPSVKDLADDLRSFSQQRPVSARRYSIAGRAILGLARHRAVSMILFAAITALAVTLAIENHRVEGQRERAIDSETAAERAQRSAEASLDDLTIKHAELLLASDPSAAMDALADYHGANQDRANQIRAEAVGRGVALLRAVPQTDNIFWLEGTPDGKVFSLSTDGTIAKTTPDGKSTVLVRGVAQMGSSAYSPTRHLLAYQCDPYGLCFFDVLHEVDLPRAPEMRALHVGGAAFSPSGNLVAVVSMDSVLTVFDVSDPTKPVQRLREAIATAEDTLFVDEDTIVVGVDTGIEVVTTRASPQSFEFPDVSWWETNADAHSIALASLSGDAVVLDTLPRLHPTARAHLCNGRTNRIGFVPGRHELAYACREGTVGTWDPVTNAVSPQTRVEGHADLLAISPAGDYVVAAGGNGTVAVIDMETNFVSTYRGHGFRLTRLAAPTLADPVILSADTRGAIRAWPLPRRLARVVAKLGSGYHAAAIDRDTSDVAITTAGAPNVTSFSWKAGTRQVGPHQPMNMFIEQAPDGRTFASYGYTDTVELWSSTTMTPISAFHTNQESISQLDFVGTEGEVLTAGHDGRLVRWTASGEGRELARFDQAIERFAVAPATDTTLIATADGTLWRMTGTTKPIRMDLGGARVTRTATDPDQSTIYVGDAAGNVIAIDTTTWAVTPLLQAKEAVRAIAITSDGTTIAIASNDGIVHVGTRAEKTSWAADTHWIEWKARVRQLALAPQGLLIAACTDGTVWLFSLTDRKTACLPTGSVDLAHIAISPTGRTAAVLDFEGRLISLDLTAVREVLAGTRP